MTDATKQFFDDLAARGREPLLAKVTATARFELSHNSEADYWLVEVDKGDLRVSHSDGPADLTLSADRKVFDGVATGEINPVAAVLRGDVEVEGGSGELEVERGSWELMVLLQRLFPGPPGGRSRHLASDDATRRTS